MSNEDVLFVAISYVTELNTSCYVN